VKFAQYTIKLNDFKKSFGFKIFTSFITVVFVVLTLFSFLLVYKETKNVKEDLIIKGGILSRFLVNSSKTAVFAENKEGLESIVDNVINEKEVLSVAVYSADWALIYNTQKKTLQHNTVETYRESARTLQAPETFKTIEAPEVIEFLSPVFIDAFPGTVDSLYFEESNAHPAKKTIGYITIALDKSILKKEINSIFLRVLGLALIFSLSGTIIIYVAVKKVSLPLTKLTENVRMLGIEGDTDKIAFESDDEIGKLTAAFNSMAEDLRKRENEKKALEEELIHAKKMEALGTLSRGIAHDFNNILSTVQGASFILKNKLDKNSPLQEYVKKIHNSLARAFNLIQSLLAFSRGQEVTPRMVNINTLVNRLAPFCENLTGEHVRCSFSFTEKDLRMRCDQTQIDQVLLNLISNAYQAMPGGGFLSVTTNRVVIDSNDSLPLLPGPYALISVSDNGAGIQEEIKERIFEPFFTTKEMGRGTGLGLSIAYGIVKQYKGHIDVSTSPGKGSTFNIFLPVIEEEKDPRQ
jgi:hypothetical protein